MKLKIRDTREDHDPTRQETADRLRRDQSLYSEYEREERDSPLLLNC